MTKELRERLSELLRKEYPEIVLVRDNVGCDWKYIEPEYLYAFIEQEIIEAERRMKERCLAEIPEKVMRDPELGEEIYNAMNTGLEIARGYISSLK